MKLSQGQIKPKDNFNIILKYVSYLNNMTSLKGIIKVLAKAIDKTIKTEELPFYNSRELKIYKSY